MKFLTTARQHQGGFSLIELMVALTIGLIIMAAVSTIMVSSKTTYTTQDSLSRLQENARFALQFMTRDLRMAGYYGCADDTTTVASQLNTGTADASWYDFTNPIEGLESYSAANNKIQPSDVALGVTPIVGSDVFAVRFLDPSTALSIQKEMTQESASMQISQNSGLAVGDIIMVTDCSSSDLMQITNFNLAGGFDHVVHNGGAGSPGNSTQKLSKPYGIDARIMKLASVRYYVRRKADGVAALFRQSVVASGGGAAPTEQELVEGVEDMRVTYGVDTSGDRVPDRYIKAGAAGLTTATEWGNVVSVRVGLLLGTLANTDSNSASKEYGTRIDTGTYDVNGETADPLDERRDRRVFVTTVTVRNRK